MFTTRYSRNTANIGAKYQSINQSLCLHSSSHCVLLKIQNNNPCLFIYNTPGKQCLTLYGFTCNKMNNKHYPRLDKHVGFSLVDDPLVQNPCYRLVVP